MNLNSNKMQNLKNMPGLQFLYNFSCRISKPYLWSKPKPVWHILTNFKIFISTLWSPPWRVCDLWSCKQQTSFHYKNSALFDSNLFSALWMDCFRPESVGTVTHEEKENFAQIKKRLRVLLEHQVWSLTPNANKIHYSNFNLVKEHSNLKGHPGKYKYTSASPFTGH